ncbi:MAG TPA: MgtC/SapB family protein [Blastocatellia bacterium]|nr:MgtC/SapB family protein [Blastocatellia bacterium]
MTHYEIALRLLMSMVFGAVIGIERQWHHKNAGIKTNTLVSIGSTVFALISSSAFGPNNNPAQVAAGVVTGVGFIGGGVIMRRGGSVQGINTAATLWAAASLGMVIGVGYYYLAILVFAAILLVQFTLRWAAITINQRSGSISTQTIYKVSLVFDKSAAAQVRTVWSDFARQKGVLTHSYAEAAGPRESLSIDASFGLSEDRALEMVTLGHRFSGTPGVSKAAWSQESVPDS